MGRAQAIPRADNVTIVVNRTKLMEMLLAATLVKGYCTDAPDMSENAANVAAFIELLHTKAEKQP